MKQSVLGFRVVRTLVIFFMITIGPGLFAQEQTVGLFINEKSSFEGYTLFNSMAYTKAYLIDNDGLEVHSWSLSLRPGLSLYLLEDGTLLRTGYAGGAQPFMAGGAGGRIERFDWDGNQTWSFQYAQNNAYLQHHDVEYLPNGNVLILAWEIKFSQDIVDAGGNLANFNSNTVWPEHIIEVAPQGPIGGEIVWEWHAWDHLIQEYDSTKANYGNVQEHPELFHLNNVPTGGPDWMHANAIDYNAELDQIAISSANWSEIWVIDHSTTSEEAAGHTGGNSGMGGDILYRWGNTASYSDSVDNKQLFFQHNVQWIPKGYPGEGNLLIYNNGFARPGADYSSVLEIVPPLNEFGTYDIGPDSVYGPEAPAWEYVSPDTTDFYSAIVSGAQRQPNGNTLICEGITGTFFEVDPAGEIVWLYVNPVNQSGPIVQGNPPLGTQTFRAERYAPDFRGLIGQDLTPGDPIEIYPVGIADETQSQFNGFALHQNYPNPFNPSTIIQFQLPVLSQVTLTVFDINGRKIRELINGIGDAGLNILAWDGTNQFGEQVASGVYIYELRAGLMWEAGKSGEPSGAAPAFVQTKKMLLVR